jgi:SSS family solute:Na+ symporter
MKTPVLSDEQCDREELRRSYENPRRFEHLKLFPGSEWEMLRPSRFDVVGVVASIAICAAIIGLLVWIAGIGSVLR